MEILLKAETRSEEKHRRLCKRIEVVERQNAKLLDQQEAMNGRQEKAEVIVDEYKRIKQTGRGYILGAAMAGTGFGVWLSYGLMQVLKGR